MSYIAQRDAIKAIVQASLPAMGHMRLSDQTALVRCRFEEEVAERKRHMPYAARQQLAVLQHKMSTAPFEQVWFARDF